jgi:hypothetical protein
VRGEDHQQRHRHDEQAIDGIGQFEELDAIGQGHGDGMGSRPKGDDDCLFDGDGQAPGGKDGVQEAMIDVADHQFLQHQAYEADHEGGKQQPQPEMAAQVLDQHHRVGAQQEQLAVGHVDDVHQPEDDDQAHGHQDDGEYEVAGVQRQDEDLFDAHRNAPL